MTEAPALQKRKPKKRRRKPAIPDPGKLVLTVPEAAYLLGGNRDYVRALIRAGELPFYDPAVRPGQRRYRHLKIRRSSLEDFLRRREELATPVPKQQRRKKLEKDGIIRHFR